METLSVVAKEVLLLRCPCCYGNIVKVVSYKQYVQVGSHIIYDSR